MNSVGTLALDQVKYKKLLTNSTNLLDNLANPISAKELFKKNLKGSIDGGEVKIQFQNKTLLNNINTLKQNNNLDALFTTNKKLKVLFDKNKKVYLQEDLDGSTGKFNLTKKNNISSLYPQTTRVMLSGNALIRSKEENGAFNTNSVPIQALNWDATDRFFLKFLKKNNLDNLNIYSFLKTTNNGKINNSKLLNQTYLRNSDFNDLNR